MSLEAVAKTVNDNDGSRIDAGRLFQTRGLLTVLNDWSLNIVLVGGTSSFIVRRRSKTGPAVADLAAVISQIGWCTPVEALVDQNCHVKQSPLPDR